MYTDKRRMLVGFLVERMEMYALSFSFIVDLFSYFDLIFCLWQGNDDSDDDEEKKERRHHHRKSYDDE